MAPPNRNRRRPRSTLSADARRLLERTTAASGVPERLEDPATVEYVVGILRVTTNGAPKGGGAGDGLDHHGRGPK
jgi:hypothetical protein